jgi:diacylglycerol kinase
VLNGTASDQYLAIVVPGKMFSKAFRDKGIEGLNTAVEKICDFIHPDFHAKIGLIKDVSAGAVMLVSIGASIIGCIIYLPKFF